MNRTVSLYEYMPYGAPELLASARTRLARALTLGSLLVPLAFLATIPLLAQLQRAVAPVILRPGIIIDPPPPLLPDPGRTDPIPPRPPAPVDHAVPTPVPEAPVTPVLERFPGTGADTGTADTPNNGPATTDPGLGVVIPEQLPERWQYIYVDELPQPVTSPKPRYPDLAREAGVQGRVLVHVLVGKDGKVIRAELDEKFNVPLLNEAALEAAWRWVFTPALSNGHAVAVWVTLPFNFKLRE